MIVRRCAMVFVELGPGAALRFRHAAGRRRRPGPRGPVAGLCPAPARAARGHAGPAGRAGSGAAGRRRGAGCAAPALRTVRGRSPGRGRAAGDRPQPRRAGQRLRRRRPPRALVAAGAAGPGSGGLGRHRHRGAARGGPDAHRGTAGGHERDRRPPRNTCAARTPRLARWPRHGGATSDRLLAQRRTCRNFDPAAALSAADLGTMLHRVWGAVGTRELAPGAVAVEKDLARRRRPARHRGLPAGAARRGPGAGPVPLPADAARAGAAAGARRRRRGRDGAPFPRRPVLVRRRAGAGGDDGALRPAVLEIPTPRQGLARGAPGRGAPVADHVPFGGRPGVGRIRHRRHQRSRDRAGAGAGAAAGGGDRHRRLRGAFQRADPHRTGRADADARGAGRRRGPSRPRTQPPPSPARRARPSSPGTSHGARLS